MIPTKVLILNRFTGEYFFSVENCIIFFISPESRKLTVVYESNIILLFLMRHLTLTWL